MINSKFHNHFLTLRSVILSLVLMPLLCVSPPVKGKSVGDFDRYPVLPMIAITERDIEKYAVKRVQPEYPVLAQKHGIEGIVIVELKVDEEGKVAGAQVVNGHSVFRSVSIDAAKRWEFKTGGGMEGTIRFTFKLK